MACESAFGFEALRIRTARGSCPHFSKFTHIFGKGLNGQQPAYGVKKLQRKLRLRKMEN